MMQWMGHVAALFNDKLVRIKFIIIIFQFNNLLICIKSGWRSQSVRFVNIEDTAY